MMIDARRNVNFNHAKLCTFRFQYVLAEQETTLKTKNEAADKLIGIVGAENEVVQKEKLIGKLGCVAWQ